jgi:hypothetical protein
MNDTADEGEGQRTFGDWLNKEMERQDVSIQQLADKTKLTEPAPEICTGR